MIQQELFIRLLSEFLEEDREWDLFDEFEKSMEDEFCRHFYCTFRKTIELCRQIETIEVPPSVHICLIESIQKTPQKKITCKRKK